MSREAQREKEDGQAPEQAERRLTPQFPSLISINLGSTSIPKVKKKMFLKHILTYIIEHASVSVSVSFLSLTECLR